MNLQQTGSFLDLCYQKALDGIPLVSESVAEMSERYLEKYTYPKAAARKLVRYQVAKCGTSGFITGLGGLLTLPVAIPANVSSVIYVQLRMIACIAYLGGHNPWDDEVRTMAYVCLTGSACADILKQSGIRIGEKLTVSMIRKIPGTVLTRLNQKVGFRLMTKFGQKGVVNLGKMVPAVGGVIGGGVDIASTKVIAGNASRLFLEGRV